ncbi:uncharacterized protein LOC143034255 [Oratosquilla oratoria]|uniref:uncharacterized protein LOC143034255 n=1 Tax=Oratosquilla oratoria TaxID=337810 RepID=UPI003F768C10
MFLAQTSTQVAVGECGIKGQSIGELEKAQEVCAPVSGEEVVLFRFWDVAGMWPGGAYKRTCGPAVRHSERRNCSEHISSTSSTFTVAMMRLILVVLLVGSAFAQRFGQPQVRQAPHIEIVRSDSTGPAEDGSYSFSFEGSDGTRREESARPTGPNLFQVQGTYSYTDPEGNRVEVRFVADENGYIAESPFLPVAPALPVHALEQIRAAEEQKRQGVVFDERGFITGRRGGF